MPSLHHSLLLSTPTLTNPHSSTLPAFSRLHLWCRQQRKNYSCLLGSSSGGGGGSGICVKKRHWRNLGSEALGKKHHSFFCIASSSRAQRNFTPHHHHQHHDGLNKACSPKHTSLLSQIQIRSFYPYKPKTTPLKINSISKHQIKGIPHFTIKFQLVSRHKILLTITKKRVALDYGIMVDEGVIQEHGMELYDHRLAMKDTKRNSAGRTLAYQFNLESYQAVLDQLVQRARNLPITSHEGSITVRFDPIPQFVVNVMRMYEPVNEEHAQSVEWSRVPAKVRDALMPFQKESLVFASQRNGRVLLADEMGLGKTLQAIAITSYYKEEWPLLIVAPGSLRLQWKNELIRWLDLQEDQILVLEKEKDTESITNQQVFIISYDLLARPLYKDLLTKSMKCRVLICDESHFIKSGSSMRTKATRALIQNATRALLLTGTAAPSRPVELYEQVKALVQYRVKNKLAQKFMTKAEFGERYCERKDQFFGVDYRGSDNLEELNTFLSHTLMMRRLKRDVMSELPDKERHLVFVEEGKVLTASGCPPPPKKPLSEIEKMDFSSAATISYYYETSMLKAPIMRKYLRDVLLKENDRFLCFAHHKSMMNALEEELKSQGVKYIRIDGDTTHKQRQKLAAAFCGDLSFKVALLSITVAGTGLTFLPCSKVVFSELYWTPGVLLQAEDRVHRIGQKERRKLDIRYVVVPKTLDDYVWPLISSKLKVISHIMDHTSDIVQEKFETQSSREVVYEEIEHEESVGKHYEEML